MPNRENISATPAELYGLLFVRVQKRATLADGKPFVDVVPKRSIVRLIGFGWTNGVTADLIDTYVEKSTAQRCAGT